VRSIKSLIRSLARGIRIVRLRRSRRVVRDFRIVGLLCAIEIGPTETGFTFLLYGLFFYFRGKKVCSLTGSDPIPGSRNTRSFASRAIVRCEDRGA
jgi:hypothetical protein